MGDRRTNKEATVCSHKRQSLVHLLVVVKDKWPSFSFNHTVLLQKLPSDIYSFNNALCAICSAFGIVVLNWFYFRTFNWTITVDFRLILYMVTKNCMKVVSKTFHQPHSFISPPSKNLIIVLSSFLWKVHNILHFLCDAFEESGGWF